MQNIIQTLQKSVEFIKGVGPAKSELLAKELNIFQLKDLLYYFPYRYIDASQLNHIRDIHANMDYVQIRGIITSTYIEGSGRAKRLIAEIADNSGSIDLVWFQGLSYMEKYLQIGTRYDVFGKINVFNNQINLVHPDIDIYNPNDTWERTPLMPLYSTSEKLKAKGMNNKFFQKLLREALKYITELKEWECLPDRIVHECNLLPFKESLINIHFPKDQNHLQKSIERFKLQEILYAQLRIQKVRLFDNKIEGWDFSHVGEIFHTFYNKYLPYELTNAQKRVIKEIRSDLNAGYQMNRLLQGDVGSGKTIVALMSMLIAIDNGFQACLMAPTEILAKQHFAGISELTEHLPIKVELLTGQIKGKQRKTILEELEKGDIHILIGTHALVEDKVVFKNLGLSIIDEQHRFGVEQRSKLWKKNIKPPHVLVMTATPIPRTLAMTLYGDLQVSIIDELPPGRKPVQTIHRKEQARYHIYEFIAGEIKKGRQIYIVYPLIHESEKLDYENLMQGYENVLARFPNPPYKIAMVHGQQDAETKDSNMRKFVSGNANILVSTTVIEVGVNVPNASVMVIENAERFGLSQLHQLRGRVGRGAEQSYCILLTSDKISDEAYRRMKIMESTQDGFKLSEEDLKMRGPGDIFGTRQSGVALDFKCIDVIHDTAYIEYAKNYATHILTHRNQYEADLINKLNWLSYFYSKNDEQVQWDKIS